MPASSTLLFVNAAQVAACTGPPCGGENDPAAAADGHAVAVAAGRVLEVGPEAELQGRHPQAERIDCAGGVLTPGLVDSHTHAVFGRYRTEEYALRCQGVPYMEIARAGHARRR